MVGNSSLGHDTYRYEPSDPTPNLGGAIFAFTGAGAVDNAPLENRGDVLTYTGATLLRPLTIIGQCQARIHARARLPNADFFVRLCDVGPDGVSINICDGLYRVSPETPRGADGSWSLTFPLHATAHSFLAGHRLRILIASGAHPRYARNPGTGEPISTAITLLANDIEILHEGTGLTVPSYDLI